MPALIHVSFGIGRGPGVLPAEGQELRRPPPALAAGQPGCRLARVQYASRWLALLCTVVASSGCVLTQDIPDPALDIPRAYKSAGSIDPNALPAIDWWRGFGSPEMTALMEEAQRVNLDVAAPV